MTGNSLVPFDRFSALLAETVANPIAVPQTALVSATIGLFLVLAFAFTAAGSKRSALWWLGALLHGAAGIALPFTTNIFTFFVVWELVTVGAGILLTQEPDARRLLRGYLPMQLFAAAALLASFSLHYRAAGTTSLEALGAGISGGPAATATAFLAVGIKAAIIPVHIWMTRTYPRVRPATTVVLSAVATKIGVFGIYRLVTPGVALELLGATMAVLGVIYALRQHRLRPFLAFHVISQIGYMTAGVGSLALGAQAGGLYHLAGNIVYKGLLFMVAAGLMALRGHDDMYRMNGIGRTRPALLGAGLTGSLAIAGVPPFNGYISKCAIESSLHSDAAVWLLIIAGIGTAASFSKFMWYSFLKPSPSAGMDEAMSWRGAGGRETIMAILCLLCLVAGLAPQIFFPPLPTDACVTLASFGPSGLLAPLAGVALFASGFRYLRPWLERLPSVTLITRPLYRTTCRLLEALQEPHTGEIRRYIGWILFGLVVLWSAAIL